MNKGEVIMKRLIFISLAMLAAASLIALDADAGRHSGSRGSKKSKTIQVREVAVKSSPNYMSSTVGKLTFGTKVDISSTEGNWYRIDNPAGYIPKNVVGTSKASVDASKRYAASGVSHDETALAGKGFNPQVESQYKKSSASLAAAYTQVDKVERMKVSNAALSQFIASGKLNR